MNRVLWIYLFLGLTFEERSRRQSPFSRMAGGGGPFHGGSGGAQMPGGMSGMHGGPTGMGPSMGGPSMGGQSHSGGASAMFNPVDGQCIRNNIVCPKWCLIEDARGCKSCPCGPAGGMGALAGGPSSGPVGGGGGGSGAYVGGGGGVGINSGGSGGSVSGGVSYSSGSSSGGTAYVPHPSGGSSTSSGSVHGSYTSTSGGSTTHTQTYMAVKPVKECAATLLCASTCKSGYSLGSTSSSGCRSCACPNSHHVSTTTIQYIVQTVAPTEKECTHTAHCMGTCSGGYVMSKTDGHGCPVCTCLQVEKPHATYQYPIEIAVEPPPTERRPITTYQTYQTQTYALTCAARSCNAGCTVGYKCGVDGCPSCECIHPSVVGMTTLHQVYIERPLTCRNTLSCPSTCSLGYKCGVDGCPTCDCLVAHTSYVQTRPQYTAQTCTHTLTCAATCKNGYELFTDGTSSCSKCACKQPVVYSVQRPSPQYQIVQCTGTDSCAATCTHGYTVIRHENRCPECQCKQAPVYYTLTSTGSGCTSNCHQTSGGNVHYYTTGTSSVSGGNTYTSNSDTYSGGSGLSYILTGGSGSSYGGGSKYNTGGTSYVVTSGGSGGSSYGGGSSGGGSYVISGRSSSVGSSNSCPPLPPDCDPLCIKYDEPHCRRCTCESSYFKFSQG